MIGLRDRIALIAGFGTAVATSPVRAAASSPAVKTVTTEDLTDGETDGGCHLGNGVKHVVQITFDNVHFFRDNPKAPPG